MVILLYNQINILQEFDENEGELERELSSLIHLQSMYVWDIYCISWMLKTLKLDNNIIIIIRMPENEFSRDTQYSSSSQMRCQIFLQMIFAAEE